MPPVTKTPRVARPGAASKSSPSGKAGASVKPESSSAQSSPRTRKPTREESLTVKMERLYMMLGTMVRPFGRFYPVLTPVGDNLKEFSEEAAEAWVDLANEDKRVKDMLESLTSASVWGNVIGIHFAIFAAAIPGGEVVKLMSVPDDSPVSPQDPIAMARAMGLSEDEIARAQAIAAEMQGAGNGPARNMGSGGPTDSIVAPPAPEFTGGSGDSAAPPIAQSHSKPGIVSPSELGVVTAIDQNGFFPADHEPPNAA